MELSLSPVVAASCAELYPIHPTAKRPESGTHWATPVSIENGSVIPRSLDGTWVESGEFTKRKGLGVRLGR